MKLNPRSVSGIVGIIVAFIALGIKQYFDLSENFYYVTLAVVCVLVVTLHGIIDDYNKKHFEDDD